jgi:hypothetical protein
LLSVLRKLIDYGKGLALALQERTARTDLFDIKMRFGLVNVAAIIACVTRGLLLAAALEARLVRYPVLPEAKPARVRAASAREPHAAPSAEQAAAEAEARLFRLPTPRQVAAALRRRPAGAVLADICHNLGITLDHPLWKELRWAIMDNDGDAGTLMVKMFRRDTLSVIAEGCGDWSPLSVGWSPAPLLLPSASGAGPP